MGCSDVSTLLPPLLTASATAGLHGQDLMDTPYRVPAPLLPWLDVLEAPRGSLLAPGALGDLGVPVVLDVDCGHVPPHLSLVQGAVARVVVSGDVQRPEQRVG